MHGWIKLQEKILRSEPPRSESSINGHRLNDNPISISANRSPSIVSLVSSENDEDFTTDDSSSSIISISSPNATPLRSIPSTSNVTRPVNIPSGSKSSETPSNILMEDISDDEILIVETNKPRAKSIETFAFTSIPDLNIPLATDLQSLPGHSDDELRDIRFLIYSDLETLSLHFQTCLALDRERLDRYERAIDSSSNCLPKIFKLFYLKTFLKSLQSEKKSSASIQQENRQLPLSAIDSTTRNSFPTDWNVNRRSSTSKHRHTPRNLFHILQLNPRTTLSSAPTTTTTAVPSSRSTSRFEELKENFERVKDILARTYSPQLFHSIQSELYFGSAAKFPTTKQFVSSDPPVITVKEMPQSPEIAPLPSIMPNRSPHPQSETIQFPPSPIPSISIDSVLIRESFVLLSPPPFPLPSPPMIEEKPSRKRKLSPPPVPKRPRGRPRKYPLPPPPPPPPPPTNPIEEIPESESDEDIFPAELPKPIIIENGLRSNFYKRTSNDEEKTRRCSSTGVLPPLYRGIFESKTEGKSHIDYRLPYDIFWFHQQRKSSVETSNISSSIETSTKKKKTQKPQQKKPMSYKKISRNFYADPSQQKLLSSSSGEKSSTCNCRATDSCDDGVCLNKLSFTECSSTCNCGSKCTNQKIRKGQWFKHLEVFQTGKYGQGLRTSASIGKGTFLCEYVGEVISEEKFLERMSNLYSKDEHHYAMKLTQNLVIDAYRMGNVARFANHSCSPNCEFQKWTVDGLPRMCMFSLRTIRPGEELTYDYNFQSFNSEAQQPCYCESPKCRGFLNSKQSNSVQHSSPSPTVLNNTKFSVKERRAVLQSSIFLWRNLRRIREKNDGKRKTENAKAKSSTALPLFFPQNFYHPTSTGPSLRKTPKLSHKDLFYLFYNHIRRSHFAKTGRIHRELIDDECYYAQLAQLALILSEIVDLIINYRCENGVIVPSSILRKCPSKRLYPMYYEIIRQPIDLAMIRSKIDQGEYSSFAQFEEDFHLLIGNAINYCGEDSNVEAALLELREYFHRTIRSKYAETLKFFVQINDEQAKLSNLNTLEEFVRRFHQREVRDGQIREILYNLISKIGENEKVEEEEEEEEDRIVYRIVSTTTVPHHRSARANDLIVHCRCGSVQDETSLVQCYACQLWQHVSCVSIVDSNRVYFCFECQPVCEENPSTCLKTEVNIPATISPLQLFDDNHQSYSTLTRDDGFVIRVNECYFFPKQDEKNIDRNLTSAEYDILFVERLWIDDYGLGQAAGYYFIRPNETFHEPHRKFFYNEVFRFPSSNDPLPISCFVRPCFVLDLNTFCKGKPISDNSSRVLASDLFICEYRVDKTARNFARFARGKSSPINTKSYCFDNYVEKLNVRRDYQPHQKKLQDHLFDHRRRSLNTSTRFLQKSREVKRKRVNGLIEVLIARKFGAQAIPDEMIYNKEFQWEPMVSLSQSFSLSRGKRPLPFSQMENPRKKPRAISISSDDNDSIQILLERDTCKSVKKRANNGKH